MKRLNQQLASIKSLFDKNLTCVATTVQTVTTAAGITPPSGFALSDFQYMLIQVDEPGATLTVPLIRYTEDGTTPTNTVGKKMSDGESFDIINATNCARLKVIKTTAAAAVTVVLQISFYK